MQVLPALIAITWLMIGLQRAAFTQRGVKSLSKSKQWAERIYRA